MGIFDFLFGKKDAGPAEFTTNPDTRRLFVQGGLEYLRKQVANLHTVGRQDDIPRAVAQFIKDSARANPGPQATQADLTSMSYGLAYFFVPQMVFKDWNGFLRAWSDPLPFSFYLALQGVMIDDRQLSLEQFKMFKTQSGNFAESIHYYLIEYPVPVKHDEKRPILGPFFTAVLSNSQTGDRYVYNLGRSLSRFPTVRAVTADGLNGNCGPGPAPSPRAFLDHLHKFVR